MADPQTSRFWQVAVQSGLIDVEGLNACFEALPPEKRAADQLDRRLARQAVQAGLLTLWQAQQILAGRSSGYKIDRYFLLEMIGQGGMGRVYLAKDSRLNRHVAIKILSPERVNNPRAIARFQREARVGAQLQHENLVRIYDEGESNGKCYLVMEYIEGKNIGTIIAENGPMPASTAARLARQVALGLEHAQLKGLIHRDVNPYNILVTSDGAAKLTDLGLAIDLAEQVPVTRDGATVGTFDYVSPEQARHSHSVDTRSDIYSLGCSLYHMITGQVPFPSPSLPEKLFGHQALEPEAISSLVQGVPEGLIGVVRKMMRKLPDERYASPLELALALEPYVDDQAPTFASGGPSANGGAPATTQTATRITTARAPVAPPFEPAGLAESVSPATPAPVTLPPELANLAGESAPDDSDLAGLARVLSFAPEPSPTERTPAARPKPAEAQAPAAPASAPSAKPPRAKTAPAPPPAETIEGMPDFSRIGAEEPASEDLSGLGLMLNFGSDSPASAPVVPPQAKVPAPQPKARPAPPPPTPKPKPAPAAPPAERLPDFGSIGGDEAPREDFGSLGLSLNLDSERTPAPPAKPKAKAPEAAPKPKPPEPPKPAPASKPVASAPEPAFDFTKIGGEAPPVEDVSGLGLGLDFGPPTPRSPTAVPSAQKAEPTAAASTPAPAAASKPAAAGFDPRLIAGAAAAALLVLVAVGLFASGVLNRPAKPSARKTGETKPQTSVVSVKPTNVDAQPTTQPLGSRTGPEVPKGTPIAVKTGDGELTTEPDFKTAMQRAIGSRGTVLLNNEEPLRFIGAESALTIGGGKPLYIRAAEGVRPVLEVEVKGGNPFLAVRSDTSITLVGVTIVAHYPAASAESPPVIMTGSNVRFERCAFEARGETKGSRAVVAEGGTLTAIGCWFSGFEKAIDIAAFGGGTTTIRQCIMVPGKPDDAQAGWAVRIRSMPGEFAKDQRRLVLDHCTAKGKGLLDLVDFSPSAPYKVEIKGCAALVDALVAWEPSRAGSGDPLTPDAFHWSGAGNQYDVRGKSWLVSSSQDLKAPTAALTDLDSWIKHINANELETLAPPVKFQNDSATAPQPQDFAVADQAGRSAGADPGQVGPVQKR